LKNVNKQRMATARKLIFFGFHKASIADLITLLFSSLQNSEGGGDNAKNKHFHFILALSSPRPLRRSSVNPPVMALLVPSLSSF
jgi:hypothetical protein